MHIIILCVYINTRLHVISRGTQVMYMRAGIWTRLELVPPSLGGWRVIYVAGYCLLYHGQGNLLQRFASVFPSAYIGNILSSSSLIHYIFYCAHVITYVVITNVPPLYYVYIYLYVYLYFTLRSATVLFITTAAVLLYYYNIFPRSPAGPVCRPYVHGYAVSGCALSVVQAKYNIVTVVSVVVVVMIVIVPR